MTTGPMDQERLDDLRARLEHPSDVIWSSAAAEGLDVFELVDELLADRDHWHKNYKRLVCQEAGDVSVACEATGVHPDAVRATAASRAAEWLRDDDDALARVDREAEIKRLRDRVTALSEARDSRLAPLRKSLLTLARAVIDGDGMSAQTLAADVLDEEKAGAL